MDAVADADEDGSEQEGGAAGAPVEPEEPDAPDEPESPKPLGETVVIVSNGGKVNIRYGNGTNYARITSVKPGSTYAYVATAVNGWKRRRSQRQGRLGVRGVFQANLTLHPYRPIKPSNQGRTV